MKDTAYEGDGYEREFYAQRNGRVHDVACGESYGKKKGDHPKVEGKVFLTGEDEVEFGRQCSDKEGEQHREK